MTPQATSYQALYRSCMKEAASRGRTLMQKLVAQAIRAMPQSAVKVPDAIERNLLTEAARILMKHESALCEAYPQALLAEFAHAIAGANNARPAALSFDSLELMGDEQMQESVDVVRTQQAVAHAVEAELTELNALVCSLQGLKTVQADRNPLRPEVYVRSLRTVTMESPVPQAVRGRWMQYLGDAMGPELALVYQELSLMLRSNGVTAAGYTVVPTQETPAAAASPVSAAMQAGSLLNLTELRRLLSGELDPPVVDDFAAQFSREFETPGAKAPPAPDFSMTVPAAFEALQEMRQVDKVMQRLKQRKEAPAPQGLEGPDAVREMLRLSATTPGQALGLEVVALMVENIAADPRLLAPVQQAVRDLEPALLRLALHDPRFFSDKKHPARRLLEQMTQRSLAWPSVDMHGFATFFDPLQQAVEALLATRVAGAEPFEFALASLEEAWGHLQERDRWHREKAVRTLLHAEQRNLLAEKIGKQLRSRPDVQAASRELVGFVAGPWSQVIAQARLLDQTGAPDPAGYTGLLSDLLWTAQPRQAASNPARLARMIPPLLEKLRHGLASIDYPSAQTQRFFDHLIALHQQALAPARPAALSTGMSREDLEAQFIDSSDSDGPWLAPTEAQESGFMNTDMSAAPAKPLFQSTNAGFGETQPRPQAAQDALDEPRLPDSGLQPGTWVELFMDGRWVRYQLTWASPHGTLFMFTGSANATHSMTRRLLDKMLTAGSLRLISGQAVVDGALDAVAQKALRNSLDEKP
ncbi:MAG: DUF1631 family protein [Burkholderiales bacterium]|nr:DUF1631 family protein [Burkholderiales bacterium]